MFAPIGEGKEKIWLISKPKEQRLYSELEEKK
jgi:hypothetical protein